MAYLAVRVLGKQLEDVERDHELNVTQAVRALGRDLGRSFGWHLGGTFEKGLSWDQRGLGQ